MATASPLAPSRHTPHVLGALSTDEAQRRHNEERAASFRANPKCVVCEQPVADARTALYIQPLDRFACPGEHSTQALERLWARLDRFGRLAPRGALR